MTRKPGDLDKALAAYHGGKMKPKKDTAMEIVRDLAGRDCEKWNSDCLSAVRCGAQSSYCFPCRAKALLKQAKKGGK